MVPLYLTIAGQLLLLPLLLLAWQLGGERVAEGQPLGEVGNSETTSEPHLHISAQAGLGKATILDDDPLVLTLDGRFPTPDALLRSRGE